MRALSRSILAPALALCAAAALPGCYQHDCTLMYAPDTLALTFEPDLQTAGIWRIDVTGVITVSCEITLPVADPNDLDEDPCTATSPVSAMLELSEDGARITGLTLWEAAPGVVDVAVSRDGTEVVAVSLEPAYELSEPNGEGCGERRYAEEEVEIPSP